MIKIYKYYYIMLLIEKVIGLNLDNKDVKLIKLNKICNII